MKRLIVIALAFVSIQGFAQEEKKDRFNRENRTQRISNLTPVEAANLHTKKMTLHLDLNDKQQKEVFAMNLENAKKRQEMMAAFKERKESNTTEKPSKEDRLKMMHAKLDHQIATKNKMKTILNAEQFDTWEENQQKMKGKAKNMMKKYHKKRGKNKNQ